MLLFSTLLNIKPSMTKKNFIDLVIEWNQTSTYQENIIDGLVWNNETEILWNGAAYRRLPKVESEHLYGEGLTITDPEIPVLL